MVLPIGWLGLLVPSPAAAADLATLQPLWSFALDGDGGGDGHDQASGVALDSAGRAVVSGWLDGPPGAEQDALVLRLTAEGVEDWRVLVDSGPPTVDRPHSRDQFWAVAVDASDNVVAGGTLADGPNPLSRYAVRRWFADGSEDWEQAYADGLQSTDQTCRAVAADLSLVWSAGWSTRGPALRGQWISFRYDASTGAVQDPFDPLFHDETALEFAPDQAYGLAVAASGDLTLVGQVGLGGDSAANADTDWHVRRFDDTGLLLWEDTQGEAFADQAQAVVIDRDGHALVAGSVNVGANNGAGRDRDWRVVFYEARGKDGRPVERWRVDWTAAPGSDDEASALVLDDDGDVWVGGTVVDPVSGHRVWHLVELDAADGAELGQLSFADPGGDATLGGLAWRDGRLLLAGSESDGLGTRLVVRAFEPDSDGDGAGDSADGCPEDPTKQEPGVCGCGVADDDRDEDTVADCEDGCPDDPDKTEPGVCFCGEPDVDGDGDGALDCVDECPEDPEKIDQGACGCGYPDDDSDGDGVPGCDDACSGTPPGEEVGPDGCPPREDEAGDTGETGNKAGATPSGCGCRANGSPASLLLVLAGLLVRRRSRR